MSILYIDAHPDLNDSSRHSRWSNGCALRRGLELGQIDPRKVTLLGCRDYDWEEVEFIRKMGITLIPAATAHRWTGSQLADEIGSRIGGDALHISLDIDSLDPSIAPGTGVPSAGGLTSRELLDFLRQLRGVRLAGLDAPAETVVSDCRHERARRSSCSCLEHVATHRSREAPELQRVEQRRHRGRSCAATALLRIGDHPGPCRGGFGSAASSRRRVTCSRRK